MKIGDLQVDFPLDGSFKLDGGAMFGVIPKPLWSRVTEVDDRNRIPLVARPMLIRSSDRTILVDTGIGGKWSEKERDIYGIQRSGDGIVSSLADLGVERDDVTDVILTHLHFDHAGATTFRDDGTLRLTFPSADHHVQKSNWDWAGSPTERDAGSYREEDFALLEGSDCLQLLDGDTEFIPGVKLELVDGHTLGLQMVRVRGDDRELLYVTDLIPTAAHLPLPYVMGYDLWPLETLGRKKELYGEEGDREKLFAFEHDPETAVCTVREGEKHVEVDEVIV